MSELKPYIGPNPTCHTLTEYYHKSEADKVIAHHKYKRCLAMAHICYKNSIACANYTMPHEKYKHWRRWQTIWSELAEKFKEAKWW